MSFASMLNSVCDIEVCRVTQNENDGEELREWQVLYQNIKCRLRNRGVDERVSSTSKYMNSTHALYSEYLQIDPSVTRVVINGKVYNVSGILNMGGGHEYLCMYLEVNE